MTSCRAPEREVPTIICCPRSQCSASAVAVTKRQASCTGQSYYTPACAGPALSSPGNGSSCLAYIRHTRILSHMYMLEAGRWPLLLCCTAGSPSPTWKEASSRLSADPSHQQERYISHDASRSRRRRPCAVIELLQGDRTSAVPRHSHRSRQSVALVT